ncbi:hypothetical protein J2N86_12845 [Legionella lytica]|uniref:Substrate of the Dot/Icm secretion system n=1 Tax=Legionella lytica TaxID=96232 RepID=A0ABY4Y8S0_9GAMM|nr:hypothetical protein [Legionella lytica]USQ13552.1 hypothetical protein J2N86_12845 [Legionella lytica]
MFKVTLHKEDYASIAEEVRKQLRCAFPKSDFPCEEILFGPEFMAPALRIDTPSTKVEFSEKEQQYVKEQRALINHSQLSPEEKRKRQQHLDSIILFGQILFAQASCLHFLKKTCPQPRADSTITAAQMQTLEAHLDKLNNLVENEGIQYMSSRFEVLSRRKEFNQYLSEIKHELKNMPLDMEEKKIFLRNLHKARDFYLQANDFNFTYANKSTRNFSAFLANYEYYGSKVSLAASLIAIAATALALIPPLAPIMGPIALAATCISMAIGVPLALKTVGTMIYNLIRFGAAPTPTELATTALVGTSIALMGAGSFVTTAIQQGLISSTAATVTQTLKTINDTVKMAGSIGGSFMADQARQKVNQYKAELADMQKDEPSNDSAYKIQVG